MVHQHQARPGLFQQSPGVGGRVFRVPGAQDCAFGGRAAELGGQPPDGVVVGRGVLDMVLGEQRVDGLGERRSKLDRGQLSRPVAKGMTVVVDRLHVPPGADQIHERIKR